MNFLRYCCGLSLALLVGIFVHVGSAQAQNYSSGSWLSGWSTVDSYIKDVILISTGQYSGNSIVIGSFDYIGGKKANKISVLSGDQHIPLIGGNLDFGSDSINSITVNGSGDIFIGTPFIDRSDGTIGHIARWNGSQRIGIDTITSTYLCNIDCIITEIKVLGNGDIAVKGGNNENDGDWYSFISIRDNINGVWNRILTSNGSINTSIINSAQDILVAGSLPQIGGQDISYIIHWNGTIWESISDATNTNGEVSVIYEDSNGDIIAGGNFTQIGGQDIYYIARWNGTIWESMGNPIGTNGEVSVIYKDLNGDIVVGGNFTQIGGVSSSFLSRRNGITWTNLGNILSGITFSNHTPIITDMLFDKNNNIIVNLQYSSGFNSDRYGIIKIRNGSVRNTIITYKKAYFWGLPVGLSLDVKSNLIFWGGFIELGGQEISDIAYRDGSNLTSLGIANETDSPINDISTYSNGNIVVGGEFGRIGGRSIPKIALWNGYNWNHLGTGVTNDSVDSIAIAPNGDIIAGGKFTTIGGVAINRIARRDGSAWSSLGSGGANSIISSMATSSNGDIIVGGNFTSIGGVGVNRIARRNGINWSSIGLGGANNFVDSIAVAPNGDIIVGGYFTSIGGVSVNRIARRNGTNWSSIGPGGANDSVDSIAVASNGDIIVGGNFTSIGGVSVNRIARRDGSAWSSLGSGGANSAIRSIEISSNGDIIVGGNFTSIGGVAINRIARRDGTSWSSLGNEGVDNYINSIAIASNGDIIIGGNFTKIGDVSAGYLGRFIPYSITPITCLGNIGIINILSLGVCLQSAGQSPQTPVVDTTTNSNMTGTTITTLGRAYRLSWRAAPLSTSSSQGSVRYVGVPITVPAITGSASQVTGSVYIVPFKSIEVQTGGIINPLY